MNPLIETFVLVVGVVAIVWCAVYTLGALLLFAWLRKAFK